jgi:ABC-type sugar transport system ATPase subunit
MKVELDDLAFSYGREAVLRGVSIPLPEGGVTVVIGPSGAGKSTLLLVAAGLLRPAQGRVLFDRQDVAGVPAERRDVGMVFQSYALFPHLSVRGNIAFGLRTANRRLPPREAAERVAELAELLGLGPLLERRPGELSGGEQQRVALARAVAPRPALLLLDEPLSALDAQLRRSVRAELGELLRRLGTTALYVTHDQEEAMLLADHLVVLDRGRVAQAGLPLELYRRPASRFVASFLGEASFLAPGVLSEAARPVEPSPEPALPRRPVDDSRGTAGSTATTWVVRPEDVVIDEHGKPATVLEARGLGPHDRVRLRLAGGEELLAHLPPGTASAPGSTLSIALKAGRCHQLAEAGGGLGPGPGAGPDPACSGRLP